MKSFLTSGMKPVSSGVCRLPVVARPLDMRKCLANPSVGSGVTSDMNKGGTVFVAQKLRYSLCQVLQQKRVKT